MSTTPFSTKPLATVLASLVLALAACGQAAPAPPQAGSASANPPSASGSGGAAPVASAVASPASASSGAPAASTAPIKVGILEPLTGTLASTGKDNEDGFNLYLDSKGGKFAGRTIDPIFADAQGAADVGLTKAKQLVESNKVAVLMGITVTPVCNAVAEYVKQAHVPLLVTGNCGSQKLTTDPKLASPYLARFTTPASEPNNPAAVWAYQQGYRKGILLTSNYQAGLDSGDMLSSIFVSLGGSIVQEMHPPLGTTDFGPYLAQLNQSGDVLFEFLPGSDGLRFGQQFADYAGQHKLQVIDLNDSTVTGPNLPQLGTKVAGWVVDSVYYNGNPSPANQAFLKAWQAKYPTRLVSFDGAMGYSSAQILEAALQKVNGKVEDQQAFLGAVDGINIETAKGPVKLDQFHDIVQNVYFWQMAKQGNGVGSTSVKTFQNITQFWPFSQQQMESFPFGKFTNKWASVTKAQVEQALGLVQVPA